MSTRKIREALDLLGQLSDEAGELVAEAESESEAIERAAREWCSGAPVMLEANKTQWRKTLESIAKDAP